MPRSLSHLYWTAARRSQARRGAAGFALPVAVGASLLLLLSSSSLQLLALQGRVQTGQLQRRHQLEDTLASAAHQQVTALMRARGCLLAVDRDAWSQVAPACQLSSEQLAEALQGQLGETRYRVSGYRRLSAASQLSSGSNASAELELQLLGERPWRAAFRLELVEDGGTWQVTALQPLGLRGAKA